MILNTLKTELIRGLYRECPGFAVYGESIRQKFERPCLVVQLKSGEIAWEGGRSRVTAVFLLHVFGEEADRQYDRLGQIAAAVRKLPAACTGLIFENKGDQLEAEAAFVMRGQLTEKESEKMGKLTEDIRFG